jgi:hypothetical protein
VGENRSKNKLSGLYLHLIGIDSCVISDTPSATIGSESLYLDLKYLIKAENTCPLKKRAGLALL